MREAGTKDPTRLLVFIDRHAARMPPVALRYAVEHLPADQRRHYRAVARTGRGR